MDMTNRWMKPLSENQERGSQLVELALVFVLLALLVAGVWDLGRMFRGYITIANAARDGARYAIRLPCIQDNASQRIAFRNAIIGAVNAELENTNIGTPDIEIDPDPNVVCPTVDDRTITVSVSVPHIMWMADITGLGDMTLTARAHMDWFGNDTR
jgi:Flp pilus assembly protein TadG